MNEKRYNKQTNCPEQLEVFYSHLIIFVYGEVSIIGDKKEEVIL